MLDSNKMTRARISWPVSCQPCWRLTLARRPGTFVSSKACLRPGAALAGRGANVMTATGASHLSRQWTRSTASTTSGSSSTSTGSTTTTTAAAATTATATNTSTAQPPSVSSYPPSQSQSQQQQSSSSSYQSPSSGSKRPRGEERPFFENEPRTPRLQSKSLPGPNGRRAMEELEGVFDTRSLNLVVDYRASFGN